MDIEIKKHCSDPSVPRPSNEKLVQMCSAVINAIGQCGASPEITVAIIKASDLWHCLLKPEPTAAFASAQAETDHLLSSPANAAHIARSIEQARNGQVQERQLVEAEEHAAPECGACPDDGSICTTACRPAEDSPSSLLKTEVNDE